MIELYQLCSKLLSLTINAQSSSSLRTPYTNEIRVSKEFSRIEIETDIWGRNLGELPFQQSVLCRQSIYRVITLAPGSHESTHSVRGLLSRDDVSILINMSDVDLDGSVVLGGDETVGRSTIHTQSQHYTPEGYNRKIMLVHTIFEGRKDQRLCLDPV